MLEFVRKLRFSAFTALLIILPVAAQDSKRILLRNETLTTEKRLQPQGLQAGAAVSGLYLLQLTGPAQPEWRSELESIGVRFLRPVPQDAFVVRLKDASLQALNAKPFVHWAGPYKTDYKFGPGVPKLPVAADQPGRIRVLLSPDAPEGEAVRIAKAFSRVSPAKTSRFGKILEGEITPARLAALAGSDSVMWIERAPAPELFDAVAAEITEGAGDSQRTHVQNLGFDGEGVTVAVADSGLDTGEQSGLHVDIAGRVDAFFYYGNLEDASDEHSHGTHVSGIIAGDGASGEADENGYLYGLGMAPKSRLVGQRMFDGLGGYEPPSSFGQLTHDAITSGAVIGSNSWGDDTQGRYDTSAMEFDALVRDGDPESPGDQPYILEFSAGNAGPGEQTIGSPAVAKNVIASGASQNNRFDFIIYAEGEDSMADFSSRGPCEDGRIKPAVVAPGTWIASLQSSAAGDENAWSPISPLYQYQGGTSQAGPQVSGAAAVFVQYYRAMHSGETPSPALVKAALINSAVDMDDESGTGPVPNNDEGWGRIDLTEIIGGERRYEYVDQTELLATGQVFEHRFYVASYFQPLKVTLAYTDVPGFPPAIPALVNDLDLEVVAPNGIVYRGNQFVDGESLPNPPGTDSINNVEGIYVPFPDPGEYILRVRGRNVQEDARRDTQAIDQDFALVVSGDIPIPGQGVVALDRRAYTAPSTVNIKLIDFDLAGQPSATVTVTSTSQTTPLTVNVFPSGSAGVFTGAVEVARMPFAADGRLHVAQGDAIEVRYSDASPQAAVLGTARADFAPPVISSVASTNRFGKELISWTTDELANSTIYYGTNRTFSISASNIVYTVDHQLIINHLVAGLEYEFYVVSSDEAGNTTTNNNNGAFYRFVARPAATVLVVNAYTYTPMEGRNDQFVPVDAYTDSLAATGVSFEVWDVETEGSPTDLDLAPFRIVIWRINDSFWEDNNTITSGQQTSIEKYLDNGGSLLVSSMELLSRLGDTPFRTNVLQVAGFTFTDDPFDECLECDQDHGAPSIQASYLEPMTSGVDVELDYSNYPIFELEPLLPNIGPDVSDVFTPTTNAAPILIEPGSGKVLGIRYPRTGADSKGRVVFLSFPLDAIPMAGPAPNNRPALLRSLLSFLAPGVNGVGTIALDEITYTVPSRVTIEVADSDLIGQESVEVQVRSDTWNTPVPVALRPAVMPGVFRGSITLVEADQPGGNNRLPAQDGDLITAEYHDSSINTRLHALAEIDTGIPTITDVSVEPDYELATVSWQTDEPTDALVQFGESTFLSKTAYSAAHDVTHSLILPALLPDRVYYYQVVSRDAAGNTVIDDNGGKLYWFRTLKPLDAPWHDDMEGAADWLVQDADDSESSWTLGVPNNGVETEAHSPTKAWGSNLDGKPIGWAETFLVTPAISLVGGNSATLSFWQSYDFTPDYAIALLGVSPGMVYISTNAQTQPVAIANYDEFTSGWELEELDLTPYIGKVVQVIFAARSLDIEEEQQYHPGWLIDDISVSITNLVKGTIIVSNNIAQASFTLEGPTPVSFAGQTLVKSNALAGEYVITFNPVPFYGTPPAQTNILSSDTPLVFDGIYTIVDANQNSISDEWESSTFGEVSPGRTRWTDTDGDGLSDYAEWVAGTDATTADSKLTMHDVSILPNRRISLTWPSVPDKTYRILYSRNAASWEQFTAPVRASAEETTLTFSSPTGSSAFFFKIEVVP